MRVEDREEGNILLILVTAQELLFNKKTQDYSLSLFHILYSQS